MKEREKEGKKKSIFLPSGKVEPKRHLIVKKQNNSNNSYYIGGNQD